MGGTIVGVPPATFRRIRPVTKMGPRTLMLLVLFLGSGAPSRAQTTPDISHDPLECIGVGEYPVVDAGIEPGKEVRTAKVYFRAESHPKFYWVEMVIHDGQFVSILPKPRPETKRIIYYIEAVDVAFNNAIDLEHDPEIRERCKDRPAAYLPGDEPGIIVGATEAGAAPLPPGFEAAGIIGTVATTGLLTSGVGGGAGIGTAVAVGAAAAGAGGIVVATKQPPPEEPTTTVVATGSTTTTSAPASGPVTRTTTTTVPGPGSTTTVVVSTTTVAGSTTTTTSVPVSSTTSVVTTTTTLPALDASCFTVHPRGECRVRVDATCVALPVDRYEWVLDVGDQWKRIDMPDGPASFIQDWSDDCGDENRMIQFRLTVHRGAASDTANESILVPGEDDLRTLPGEFERRVRFQTHLAFPPFDGRLRGRIVVNGTEGRDVDNSQPVALEPRGVSGVNSVAATLTRAWREPGHWRFDFGNAPNFTPGSLRVVRGNVVSVDDHAVVFRLRGQPGERVELTFELRR